MEKTDPREDQEGAILNRDGVREGLLACKEDLKVTEGANRGMGYGGLFEEAGTANAKAWRQPHFFLGGAWEEMRAGRQGQQLPAFKLGPCSQKGLCLGS